jgi:hypothetical protein
MDDLREHRPQEVIENFTASREELREHIASAAKR